MRRPCVFHPLGAEAPAAPREDAQPELGWRARARAEALGLDLPPAPAPAMREDEQAALAMLFPRGGRAPDAQAPKPAPAPERRRHATFAVGMPPTAALGAAQQRQLGASAPTQSEDEEAMLGMLFRGRKAQDGATASRSRHATFAPGAGGGPAGGSRPPKASVGGDDTVARQRCTTMSRLAERVAAREQVEQAKAQAEVQARLEWRQRWQTQ